MREGLDELLEEQGQAHDTHTDTGRLIRVVQHDNAALSLMCPVKQSVNRIGGSNTYIRVIKENPELVTYLMPAPDSLTVGIVKMSLHLLLPFLPTF